MNTVATAMVDVGGKMGDNAAMQPSSRRIRVFAFDPSLAGRLATVGMNELTLHIPWEEKLERGPAGDYIEVVDHDPASQAVYPPVDLNHPQLLAQDGLEPSVADPRFHQQMVYAVAMATIDQFERALGRVALWATRKERDANGVFQKEHFVSTLRIYPHALREANAYYSPQRNALLFGYFPAPEGNPGLAPGTMVFTCLAHDVIVHETTHALLDGLHPRFREATNEDLLGLHEAFADIAAIFQRFSYAEVLKHQLATTRGDLNQENLLAQLAQQFGMALGGRGALRDALGAVDKQTGEWNARQPDATLLTERTRPHERGAILVAAVFRAFLDVYGSRIADLLRIATQGTGQLPEGELHPDLVERLADEAAETAQHCLQMCIRGLDYCPPLDVTFGDYLRGIITADYDLSVEDPLRYRVAMIDAFRAWGIYPEGMLSLSESAVRWPQLHELKTDDAYEMLMPVMTSRKKSGKRSRMDSIKQESLSREIQDLVGRIKTDWNIASDRETAWRLMKENAATCHSWLMDSGSQHADVFGLVLGDAPRSVYRAPDGRPSVEVHSVRAAIRGGPRGSNRTELVVEITQRRRGYFDRGLQRDVDDGTKSLAEAGDGDFRFRRGCTLLINPSTFEVRYVIKTRGDIADDEELERVRSHLTREAPSSGNSFTANPGMDSTGGEDFARLHRRGS